MTKVITLGLPLKTKDQVFDRFLGWKAMVEKSSGKKLKTFRTDNGGEYTSKKLKEFLKPEGIRHEYTISKPSEQNRVAEQLIKPNTCRISSLNDTWCKTSTRVPGWSSFYSCFLHKSLHAQQKLSVKWRLTKHGLVKNQRRNHLRVFGCYAYSHVTKDEQSKFDSKVKKCILLGYMDVKQRGTDYSIQSRDKCSIAGISNSMNARRRVKQC